jgi:hypothetical protein
MDKDSRGSFITYCLMPQHIQEGIVKEWECLLSLKWKINCQNLRFESPSKPRRHKDITYSQQSLQ